jgi:nucleoside-diphosphate-sugar epimerase
LRPEDPKQRKPETTRARAFGWTAKTPLGEGLRQTYAWLLSDALLYAS